MSTRPPGAFRSVVDMWCHRVDSTPHTVAMLFRRGDRWEEITWRQADERVRAIAHALVGLGLTPSDRVGILADTSVAWVLTDIGVLAAGGATTTIYPTSTAEETAFILADAGVRFVFCEDERQANKVRSRAEELPDLAGIILLHGKAHGESTWTLDQLEQMGRERAAEHPDELDRIRESIGPDSLATLIYTSGTTGQPKGVMLSHDAWVYEGEAIDRLRLISPADRQLLFLPLAHVFAKVMEILFIRLGVPTAIDGSMGRLMGDLETVRPTWLAGVPRVFEKMRNAIVADVEDRGWIQQQAFRHAMEIGRDVAVARREGRVPRLRLRLAHAVLDRTLFSKIRERLGGRLRFMVSGGAPLSVDVAEFFDAIGIVVCEGYGLTESAAASCVNTPTDVVIGTVGKPLPGCEVRIADDGEILLRSRGVMQGYHNDPETTARVLTEDGWLLTGDIGLVRPSGHIEITDRKKDLIVTAGGKNVAPALFEERLKARSPFVSLVLVHGDRRNFCSALVTLEVDVLRRWARREGLSFTSSDEMAKSGAVRELVGQAIDDVNQQLAPHEQVRRFAVLAEDFTVDNGLLTPSHKMKRRDIEARYSKVLEDFYEGSILRL